MGKIVWEQKKLIRIVSCGLKRFSAYLFTLYNYEYYYSFYQQYLFLDILEFFGNYTWFLQGNLAFYQKKTTKKCLRLVKLLTLFVKRLFKGGKRTAVTYKTKLNTFKDDFFDQLMNMEISLMIF